MPNEVTREQVVEQARSYIDTPWRHLGRGRQGIDCAGLIIRVAQDLALSQYDTDVYARRPRGQSFAGHFKANMIRIPIKHALPGDALLFRNDRISFPHHCGIVAERDGHPTFIHSTAGAGKVREEWLDGEWARCRTHAFRFHGLAEDWRG